MASETDSILNLQVSTISITELKSLWGLPAQNSYRVQFRFRLLSEMWQPNFMQLMNVTSDRVVFTDKVTLHYKVVAS